jgi:peptidoglycan/LPS O-acetylase OafA/YrhL
VDLHLVLQHILFIGPAYQANQYNTVFWTLILEMQISVIFPGLLSIVRRIPANWDWLVVGLVWVLGFCGVYFDPLSSLCRIIYWSSFFMAGAVLARRVLVVPDQFSRIFGNKSALAIFLPLLVCSTFIAHNGTETMRFLSYLPCGLGSLGTILCALYNPTFRRLLKTNAAIFLGHISYSLYLLHAFVLNMCFHLLYPSWTFSLIFLPYVIATLVLATLMQKFVETPSIQFGQRLTAQRVSQKHLEYQSS